MRCGTTPREGRSSIPWRSTSRKRLLCKLFPSLGDEQGAVDHNPRPRLLIAGRPAHFDSVDLIRFSDPEVEREGALRVVTPAAHHVGDLFTAVGHHRASRTDGAAIGPRSGERDG